MSLSVCNEKSIKIGKFCLSNDDYGLIIMNLITITIVLIAFYLIKLYDKSKNLSINVKNNFTPLGEGLLSNFYTASTTQQKNTTTKKKVQSKTVNQIIPEKNSSNELTCNQCKRPVEVSYQFSMHKLTPNLNN